MPPYLSNGDITQHDVNYTLLGKDVERTSLPAPGTGFYSEMTLRENLIYRFVVDGKTVAGSNTSLEHKCVIISTMKQGGNVFFVLFYFQF